MVIYTLKRNLMAFGHVLNENGVFLASRKTSKSVPGYLLSVTYVSARFFRRYGS